MFITSTSHITHIYTPFHYHVIYLSIILSIKSMIKANMINNMTINGKQKLFESNYRKLENIPVSVSIKINDTLSVQEKLTRDKNFCNYSGTDFFYI